jgi:hypothetical protein
MAITNSAVLFYVENGVSGTLSIGSEQTHSGQAKQDKNPSDQLHQR